jgi:hypothetical protein
VQKEHCLNAGNWQCKAEMWDSLLGDCQSALSYLRWNKMPFVCRHGHRRCHINTSGWPQNVPHQHFRMATECAIFSLIPSDVRKVSTVLPSINKMQFVLFHVSRLTTASVSQSVNFVYADLYFNLSTEKTGHGTLVLKSKDLIYRTNSKYTFPRLSAYVTCLQQITGPRALAHTSNCTQGGYLTAVRLHGGFIGQNGDQTTKADIFVLVRMTLRASVCMLTVSSNSRWDRRCSTERSRHFQGRKIAYALGAKLWLQYQMDLDDSHVDCLPSSNTRSLGSSKWSSFWIGYRPLSWSTWLRIKPWVFRNRSKGRYHKRAAWSCCYS